jgi:hypothetical protein
MQPRICRFIAALQAYDIGASPAVPRRTRIAAILLRHIPSGLPRQWD